MFPKVPDYHKPNKPLIPNGLGVVYVLVSVAYLFLLGYMKPIAVSTSISLDLTLAVCILFGGFMGLLDDWMNLRWRYKAFFPVIASVPLISLATKLGLRTSMDVFFWGAIDFGLLYYYFIIPIIVTVTTNTVNQLGGFNGLETICPAIVLMGLMTMSELLAPLLYAPLLVWLALAFYNVQGKIFVGNSGSFSIGITLAAFAIISDLKFSLLISLFPFIVNSTLILFTYFFLKKRANVTFNGKKLFSNHVRSLVTLITYHRFLTERQILLTISLLVAASTLAAVFFHGF